MAPHCQGIGDPGGLGPQEIGPQEIGPQEIGLRPRGFAPTGIAGWKGHGGLHGRCGSALLRTAG